MQELHLIRVFREHVRTWQDRPAMRAQLGGPGSPWLEVTWGELGRIMDLAAQGLIALGHQAGDMVGLCSRNMPEWTQADLAILAARGVTVPLYPTSTLEQARFIIRDAGIHILVVGEQAQVDLALALLAQGEIAHVVALDGRVDLRGCPQALTLQALMALGNAPALAEELARRAADFSLNDLLTLVYTSGTTGEPKGVMLDHANLTAAMRLHDGRLKLGPDDVSLCMLPLSHIFERAWTFYVLYRGATNVYLRDPQTVIQVIGEVKPTHMCAVPRVYEKAYAGIQGRMDKAPRLLRGLFRWAMGVGADAVQLRVQGRTPGPWLALKHKVADRLVFRKLRGLFGGRCRFFPVAGASLADDVNLFFQAIGLNLKYGYGLSETCATVSCYEDTGLPIGTLGRPLDGLEVKLGEENEILVKGPTIMRGYFNRPEETARVTTADGFLRTGDAGNLDPQGNLIFTERIKELMKTSNGQYVAPQKVEGTLGKDAFIDQIAIIADSRNFVSALIVPSFEGLEEHARAMGLKYRNMAELLAHSKVVEFFESRIHRLQAELAKHEQVKKFTLLPRAFSMEMGELTPTLKLRRKCIEAAFRSEIEAMYKKMTS
jgi:long-chain acyl-CoA synthetase